MNEKNMRHLLETLNFTDVEKNQYSDNNFHREITNSLFDRIKKGEETTKTINDLARYYASFYNSNYYAFLFAADSLRKKAWEMNLLDKQRNNDDIGDIDLNEDIYNDIHGTNIIEIKEENIDYITSLFIENNISYAIDSENENLFYLMDEDFNEAIKVLNDKNINYEKFEKRVIKDS